jgi:acetyl esterase/lipase
MSNIKASLLHRLRIIGLTLLQALQRTIITTKQSRFFSPATQPDKTIRILAQRRSLCPARIFTPQNGENKQRALPLVIMVHGGGFMMNRPCVDDPLARIVADTCNCLVVSIDYRKAPAHPFPAAYEDTVESILELLGSDVIKGADTSKVILCGNASGGNLVLGVPQDPRLQGKFLGVVSVAPIVNFVPSADEQLAKRPDHSIPDALAGWYDTLLGVYACTKNPDDLRDLRMSPTYFRKRTDLPKHILMVGMEHDLLCHETKVMAEKLAGSPRESTDDGWRAGTVQWKLIKGQTHGFGKIKTKDPKEEDTREQAKNQMFSDIAQWIAGAFKDVN